jgi:hypothetical protein
MVDRDGLCDLQEPDQLQAVQALGPGLVAVDLGEPGVHGGVSRDGAVDVCEPEVAANGMHHRVHRRVHQPVFAELADVELDVGSLDPDQRVEAIIVAPSEPSP